MTSFATLIYAITLSAVGVPAWLKRSEPLHLAITAIPFEKSDVLLPREIQLDESKY